MYDYYHIILKSLGPFIERVEILWCGVFDIHKDTLHKRNKIKRHACTPTCSINFSLSITAQSIMPQIIPLSNRFHQNVRLVSWLPRDYKAWSKNDFMCSEGKGQ